MQNKKRKQNRTHKNKIRNIKSIMYRKMYLSYVEKLDKFVCSMIVYIDNRLLSIIGDLDPNSYMDGIKVKTPKGVKLVQTNCSELFISKNDSPNMYNNIISYINETGDKLDSNEYVKYLHGSLTIVDTSVLVDDKNLDKVIQRLSYYD